MKGGGAWERDRYSTAILATGAIEATFAETRGGWTVGVGGEYAFTNFMSAFVEYGYYNFGTRTDTFNLVAGGNINYSIKETKNVILGGINFRWNGAAVR